MSEQSYRFVHDLWSDARALGLSPVERLVYRSNILGADDRITNTGGGNTSSKVMERDPVTGDEVEVLWVKGSGGDLRTSTRENFSSLYQDKVLSLKTVYEASEARGVKTPAEDRMVAMYAHCTFNLNPRPTSIDTPLHAFIPEPYIDHTHPHAVIAVAASRNAERLTREIYGDEIAYIPWQRPGLELGMALQRLRRERPNIKGAVLGQHGLIDWADDDKACYHGTLRIIEKAAEFIAANDKGAGTFGGARYEGLEDGERKAVLARILPWLRGQVSQRKRLVCTVQYDAPVLQFVNSHDAPRLADLGTSCPDHFLRTKIKPLYVAWDPRTQSVDALKVALADGLAQYREDYAAYYEGCKRPGSPAMRDQNPTVILIPGIGMIAWGKDKSESRVTAEFYNGAIAVMRGAEAIDEYIALPAQEAFDIEYWSLEEAKLQRMPPEKELARQVVAVVGGGNGIGREVAMRLVSEGAHIVAIDRDAGAAQATADAILAQVGLGIGVAGTGISGCGQAIGLGADVTDRASLCAALEEAVLAYGGVDSVVVTAGIVVAPDTSGHIPDEKWAQTFAVNVTGSYLVADEMRGIWDAQDLGETSLVLTTSANGVAAKRGSLAYDASKAAVNHLIRELAIELAPRTRVNGVAPAAVVQGSAMFPRERVVASLVKYGISHSESEDDETLRGRLSRFYADRTLLKETITPADQAEAVFLLLSRRLAKTTGQIISVDGGLSEAFLR